MMLGVALFALGPALSGCGLRADESPTAPKRAPGPDQDLGDGPPPIPEGAALEGHWSASFSVPIEAVHASLLPTGKVLLYDVKGGVEFWDPETGVFSPAPEPTYDIFCSGHATMPDGKLFVAGGRNVLSITGAWNASLFDPFAETWTMLPDMNAGRWYPSVIPLANGDVLVVAGSIDPNTQDTLPQVWSTSTGSWRDLTGAGQLVMATYPRAHLAPNGKIFVAGPDRMTRYLDTSGTGLWSKVGNMSAMRRSKGSSVQYDDGKILVMGGVEDLAANTLPIATAEIIDLGDVLPHWTTVAPMTNARAHCNATLLPDGKILVTGGTGGAGADNVAEAALPAEVWDPATATWTTMASLGTYRGYHSTAMLLPDGRVLSAGGAETPPGSRSLSGEIYSPPYLFKGARPELTSAPATAAFGETFHVETPDPAAIASVVWLSLPAVTHMFNMTQRRNVLAFSPAPGGGLDVTAPTDPNLCPPGYKMLFLLDAQGVPSVAHIIRAGGGEGSNPVVPGPAPTLSATVTGGDVYLSWDAAPANATGFKLERAMSLQNGVWSPLATLAASKTSITDGSVGPATTYHYRMRAYNDAGHSPYSTVIAVQVP